MSQENVEIVRRGVEAANRSDLERFLIYLDPHVEIRSAVIGIAPSVSVTAPRLGRW